MNIIVQLPFGKPETVRLHTKINWATKKYAKYSQELKRLALHLLAQCANNSCSASRHMLKQYAYMLPKRVTDCCRKNLRKWKQRADQAAVNTDAGTAASRGRKSALPDACMEDIVAAVRGLVQSTPHLRIIFHACGWANGAHC